MPTGSAGSASTIETVDLEPFRLGSDNDRRTVAGRLDAIYSERGFLQVVGHGVAPALMAEMLDVTAEFFDRPAAEKEALVVADKSANRGYSGVGTEALAYSLGDEPAAPDLFEAFNAGREDTNGEYYDRHRPFFAPNVWPAAPDAMRDLWRRYSDAALGVADTMLDLFALALDADPAYFRDRTRRAIVTARAINYERRPGTPDPAPGQLRMGAHTDYGVLTILLADPVPGLQIHHDDQWIDVPIVPGGFVVNIGDMMATWTNDRWVSTLHRVVPPPAGLGGPVRRRSVAQFLEADPDAIIECLPSCTSAENPPKHPPVTSGDYLLAKLMGPKELRRSAAPSVSRGNP